MTDFWQDLIQQQAALSTHHHLNTDLYYTPLAELAVVAVSGEQASTFLQNLTSNDVTAIAVNQAQLTSLCNIKGRVVALFLLIRRADHYQLILANSMTAVLQQRLTMYKLRAKVAITDRSDQLICLGVIRSDDKANNYQDPTDAIPLPYDEKRLLLVVKYPDSKPLIQSYIDKGYQLSPSGLWQQRDIEMGIPMIVAQSSEKFTPQQLNLDLINGVSFNKGCYPGQEVVARLHYLGKPSRRLFKATATSASIPTIADNVTDDQGNIAGHIIAAQLIADNQLILLVSLKLAAKHNRLFIENTTEIIVEDWG